MTAAQRAMTRWVGTLARGGVLDWDEDSEAGIAVAVFVVGEDRLDELRAWFGSADFETVVRERRACVEVCIWMAHADRVVHPEERHLLRQLVGYSGLDADTQDELVMTVHEPPPIEGIEERLTNPVLRELMLTMAWELAMSDGEVAESERGVFADLARRLEISEERGAEIRAALSERIG